MFIGVLFTGYTILAALVLAAPTARQNGLQIIRNCYQSGQVALTFDGTSPLSFPFLESEEERGITCVSFEVSFWARKEGNKLYP